VSPVHVVLPGDVDDVSVPSGGNSYDRHLCEGLEAVHEIVLAGGWPRPDDSARTALAGALAEIPDGEVALLDGLVACGVPEIVVPQAKRLRVAVLVHLPLGDETGLAPALEGTTDSPRDGSTSSPRVSTPSRSRAVRTARRACCVSPR